MTVRRIAAIAAIFLATSVAWTVLGSSVLARTGEFDERLEKEVGLLWGHPHRQIAPAAWIDRPDVETTEVETTDSEGRVVRREVTRPVLKPVPVLLESTAGEVRLDLEHRQRGLLWYPTYSVTFAGTYRFQNPDTVPRTLHIRVPLPAQDALFDGFVLTIDGRPVNPGTDISKEVTAATEVGAGATTVLGVRYASRGLRTWSYAFAPEGTAQVRDFQLTMSVNARDIDFPAGTISPSEKTETSDGWRLTWRFENLISGQAIGVELPNKLNPGPFAARVTFFAPVSLLFFLAVMVIVGVVSGQSLHPMHYWFIAAAFFAFHLLLAYLVDHLAIWLAFSIAAAVSLFLVVSYLRIVSGMRQALLRAGVAQAVFLVLFSCAFFVEGFTGLAITIGGIITLFVLMQMTARVSWEEVFAGTRGHEHPLGERR